jgi:signal transduction histidine kinase
MKRSWTTITLSLGLAALLGVLGVLQYRWQVQANEAAGDKARKQVKEQADRFATDFNREIQNAYFNFQTEPADWQKGDWSAFNERYDFWHEKTGYPDLIDSFYFLKATSDEVLRYDTNAKRFTPVEPDADVLNLRARLEDQSNFRPVQEDLLTLVLPIHEPGKREERIVIRRTALPTAPSMDLPPALGWLAIKLDPDVIRQKLVPELAEKYFGDGEFNIGIDDRTGGAVWQNVSSENADATAKLFDLSPDNFIFFANRGLMSSLGEKRETVVLNSRVESRGLTPPAGEAKPKMLKIELQNGGVPRTRFLTSVDRGDESPWTLAVQHSAGSIDTAMAAMLRRNLAASFGLLLLLAGAVGAIIISALRAKRYAQRQIDFVSSVSHEFRTPLAVIYSAGENLADGVARDDGQVTRYGELIKGEGRKLSSMVEQILDFAGARSGRRKFALQNVNVGDVIDDAISECRPLLDEKNFEVECELAGNLPAIVADQKALSQALQNLIANSVKYSNGSSWLGIKAQNGGSGVRIRIEDHGIGISKGDLKHVFEPFFRSKEVVDAQIHGNGLGLSLVSQIVEAHKGKVTVESEPGKGSHFTIELPAVSEPSL